jgi:hypothetical protein
MREDKKRENMHLEKRVINKIDLIIIFKKIKKIIVFIIPNRGSTSMQDNVWTIAVQTFL